MRNSLSVFDFNCNEVRVILIDNEPWFVAKDVLVACNSKTKVTELEALVCKDLGEEFVSNEPILDRLKRHQNVLVLAESALTFYVSRSRTELGKKFNRWLHIEVLPSIRKTGQYSIKQQPQLSSEDKATKIADAIAHIKDKLGEDNPRLTQFLIDHAISDIMPTQKALTGDKLRGVVEIAEELKLPVTLNNRGQLGKFVKARLESSIEERLVNGTMRKVNCYPDNEETREIIKEFFS